MYPQSLWLVGCGRMGGALLKGWLRQGMAPSSLTLIDPHPPQGELADIILHHKLRLLPSLPSERQPEMVVLAVKPQMMKGLLADPLMRRVANKACFLSIAAGWTLDGLAGGLGLSLASVSIVRSMPNTPCAVGQGISAWVASQSVSNQQRFWAKLLLEAGGKTIELDDENLMDAVTALSGSGPAYVFALMEAMTAAAIALGLEPAMAAELTLHTVAGAGQLVLTSGQAPSQLRAEVTSPAGTTAAALVSLLDKTQGLPALLNHAMRAACARSKELAS